MNKTLREYADREGDEERTPLFRREGMLSLDECLFKKCCKKYKKKGKQHCRKCPKL